MILNAMRYFGLSLLEAERMTYGEYRVYLDAHRLKQIDMQREMALTALLTRAANQTKRDGTYRYTTVDDLVDLEDLERQILGDLPSRSAKFDKLREIARRSQSFDLMKKAQGKDQDG